MTVVVFVGSLGVSEGSVPEDPNANLWVAQSDFGNGRDEAIAVALSPDGSKTFVTGSTKDSTGDHRTYDYATVAYSTSTGAQLWSARYNGPANLEDRARSISVSPDGSMVFVTGSSESLPTPCVGFLCYPSDYATVAYSTSDGTQVWVARYGGLRNATDYAYSVAVSPDSATVFVTGSSADFAGCCPPRHYATVAYSASDGSQLWVARYEASCCYSYDAIPTSLVVSPDGTRVFVTGHRDSSRTASDYATVAYSTESGAEIWVALYDRPPTADPYPYTIFNFARSVAISPDGSKVFVTGWQLIHGTDNSRNYVTVAYSSTTGELLWVSLYEGLESRGADTPSSLGVSPDGSKVFVTGSSEGEYATVAYSATLGSQLWVARFSRGASDNQAFSLAASPDGSKVFVTGYSEHTGLMAHRGYDKDFATVAYSALDGKKLWAATFDGPAINFDDVANSIAVSPDGSKVLVAGISWLSQSSSDFVTVAYDATRTTSCANGSGEHGQVSGQIDEHVEPEWGRGDRYVHGVNCDLAGAGL